MASAKTEKIGIRIVSSGGRLMCTAATYKTKDFYFGRTLDNDCSYGEQIVVMPRNYKVSFRNMGTMKRHYAMIGMAHVRDDYPLFYDAVNEKGLGMAGLNFMGNACYNKEVPGKENVAVFEFITWVLAQCATVKEAEDLLEKINLTDTPFEESLPVAELHWIIADSEKSITVESTKKGLGIFDNPAGILTNNPPFEEQMFQLNNYMNLSPKSPQNHFSDHLPLHTYCRGMGALGLPGDLSSQSRFVRAAFVKMNSVCGETESASVSQFFHILGSVDQQRGCSDVGEDSYEITIYTSCCNAAKGIYYYTTYGNHQITAVCMRKENLNGIRLVRYPLIQTEQIKIQNC